MNDSWVRTGRHVAGTSRGWTILILATAALLALGGCLGGDDDDDPPPARSGDGGLSDLFGGGGGGGGGLPGGGDPGGGGNPGGGGDPGGGGPAGTAEATIAACRTVCPKSLECGIHRDIGTCEADCAANVQTFVSYNMPAVCYGRLDAFYACIRNISCEELDRINNEEEDTACRAEQLAVSEACAIGGGPGGSEREFVCNDGSTIPDNWVCDGDCDCAGCEDEWDCGDGPGTSNGWGSDPAPGTDYWGEWEAPTTRSATLAPGFQPNPYEAASEAGGTVPGSNYTGQSPHTGCRGVVPDRPQHRITFTESMFVEVLATPVAGRDLTMVITGPGGLVWCNDDYRGLDPGIRTTFAAGTYDIFIGTYGSQPPAHGYTLTILEVDGEGEWSGGWSEEPPPTDWGSDEGFLCFDGEWIPWEWVCDDVCDCSSCEDEEFCG